MFIKSMRGDYYPVSKVLRIWSEGSDKSKRDMAEIKDVGDIVLNYGEFEAVTEIRYPMISAAPDFFVLDSCQEEDGTFSIIKSPVLGWQYTSERGMMPVTVEGINHFNQDTCAILAPDGRVFIAMDRDFDNVDDYIAYLNEPRDA